MNIRERLARGAAWSLLGSGLGIAIMLVATNIIARELSREIFGRFILLQNTVSTAGMLAGFGLGATATRYIAALRHNDLGRLGSILGICYLITGFLGVVGSVAVSIASLQITTFALGDASLGPLLSACAFGIAFSTADGLFRSSILGLEATREFALVVVLSAVVNAGVLLMAARLGGLDLLSSALVLSGALQALISWWVARRVLLQARIRVQIKGCWREWQVVSRFAIPSLLSAAMVTPAHWLTQAMLANTERGFREVAALGIAMQWLSAVTFLPNIVSRFVLPVLTHYVSRSDLRTAHSIVWVAVKTNGLLAFMVALGIGIFGAKIMSAYGVEYSQDATALILVGAIGVLVTLAAPIGSVLAATERMWTGFIMNFAWALLYILATFLLVDRGAVGVLTALIIAYMAHTIWTGLWAKRLLNA